MNLGYRFCAVTAMLCAALPLTAQQRVPMRGDTPVAPPGVTVPPLPSEPVVFETGEGMDIRVVVLARGLEYPWSIAFLPNGDKLVVERAGRLRLIHNDRLEPEPITGVPAARIAGFAGLGDVVLHPQFTTNRLIYLTYNKPIGDSGAALGIARGVWDGRALTRVEDIFVTDQAGGISRAIFGADGKLYVTTFGGQGDDAQNPTTLGGKTLRLNDDGSVPDDNPFVGQPDVRPEIYTLGHRTPSGLAVHPVTGAIWEVEMGPNGGDEVNVLEPGANYGWPLVSLGRTYGGPWHSDKFNREGMHDPVVFWMPSISTTGLDFYTGDRLPSWKGDLFVGGVRYGEIPGTGQLQRILFNENMEELRREVLLADLHQRIRDVRMGPDELLYVLTDSDEGAVLRIEPAD
jgi:glucose/arabinose dehydrogenase